MSGSTLTHPRRDDALPEPLPAPRVRHQLRDNLLVMAATAGASVLLTLVLVLLTRMGR